MTQREFILAMEYIVKRLAKDGLYDDIFTKPKKIITKSQFKQLQKMLDRHREVGK